MNATGIGAKGTFSAAVGAPGGTIATTHAGSWVWGVGFDPASATGPTVAAGQTLLNQLLGRKPASTSWVQSTTLPTPVSGTNVTINDTAPTAYPYVLAVAEIL